MKKIALVVLGMVLCLQAISAQTLTFLLRNPQIIAGPKFQYEVWIKSSDGTSRMGSALIYNNYDPLAFGVSVASNGNATVIKNASVFGSTYGQNPTNDNTSSRFAYSWTYLGGAGSGVVVPSSGDGVLAFTVQINIININEHAGVTYEQTLMDGEEYKDDEITPWPVVDASDFVDPPLPIQLASFTGTALASGDVRLDWTTLSEINNYGFEAQRRPGAQGEFQTIPNSFVPGHGTTNEPHTYAYTDTTTSAGQWRYRLKQTDLDGTIHFGPEVTVLVTGVEETRIPTVFALQQNYPNPFNPSTTLRYQLPREAHVTLRIWTALGQEVATLVDRVEEAGYKSVVWRAENVSSGVYFYRLTATAGRTSFTDVGKMLVLK